MSQKSYWAILPLMVLFLSAFDQVGWKEFVSTEGGFATMMPSAPNLDSVVISTTSGPLNYHRFSAQGDSIGYILTYTDLSDDALKATSPTALMDDTRQGVITSSKGRLVSEKEIALDGHSGRDARIEIPKSDELPEGGSIRFQIFLVGNRLYQLAIFAKNDDAFSDSVATFFTSFRLLGK